MKPSTIIVRLLLAYYRCATSTSITKVETTTTTTDRGGVRVVQCCQEEEEGGRRLLRVLVPQQPPHYHDRQQQQQQQQHYADDKPEILRLQYEKLQDNGGGGGSSFVIHGGEGGGGENDHDECTTTTTISNNENENNNNCEYFTLKEGQILKDEIFGTFGLSRNDEYYYRVKSMAQQLVWGRNKQHFRSKYLILHFTIDDLIGCGVCVCVNTSSSISDSIICDDEEEAFKEYVKSEACSGFHEATAASSMHDKEFILDVDRLKRQLLDDDDEDRTIPTTTSTCRLAASLKNASSAFRNTRANLAIVMNGFSVTDEAALSITGSLQSSFDSVVVVSTREFLGYSKGINTALHAFDTIDPNFGSVIPGSSLVFVSDASTRFRSKNKSMDIYQKMELMLDQYGAFEDTKLPYIFYSPVPLHDSDVVSSVSWLWSLLAPIPFLAFDPTALSQITAQPISSLFDEKFLLQGSIQSLIEEEKILSINVSLEMGKEHIFWELPQTEHNCSEQDQSDRFKVAQLESEFFNLERYLSVKSNRRSLKDNYVPLEGTRGIRKESFLSPLPIEPIADMLPSSLRVCAVICVYDDARFLESLLGSLLPSLHHVIILISSNPWGKGSVRPIDHTIEIARRISSSDEGREKVTIITGVWDSEGDQRNFGNMEALRLGASHVMVLDGDEYWHPVLLERALRVSAQQPILPPFARAPMITHFGSMISEVYPPERLQILWLVSPSVCHFTSTREIECVASNEFSDQGLFLASGITVCNHLSYVRTNDELINKKFASFEHKHEIIEGWVENIWESWKNNTSLRNLHPTYPPAYESTRFIPFIKLPPALRQVYLHTCTEPYGQNLREGNEKHDDLLDIICGSSDFHEGLERPKISIGVRKNDRKQIHHRSGSKTGASTYSSPCKPSFLLVILKEGEHDDFTVGVFEDTALILEEGLRALLDISKRDVRVNTMVCNDVRHCELPEKHFVIILAGHHLARYTQQVDGKMLSYAVTANWPPFGRSVIYNMEFIGGQIDFNRNLSSPHSMWEVYDHIKMQEEKIQGEGQHSPVSIWDYSLGNFYTVLSEGYRVQHVPLGYVDGLKWSQQSAKDIDVLFYGHLNTYRAHILQNLRAKGLAVRYANQNENFERGVYGNELHKLVKRSKIILSLAYFDISKNECEEWKMTRFLRPLANEILIVSEHCGHDDEINEWKEGIVFSSKEKLEEVIEYYLTHETEAKAIAKRGRLILESKPEQDILYMPIRNMVRAECPNWNP